MTAMVTPSEESHLSAVLVISALRASFGQGAPPPIHDLIQEVCSIERASLSLGGMASQSSCVRRTER